MTCARLTALARMKTTLGQGGSGFQGREQGSGKDLLDQLFAGCVFASDIKFAKATGVASGGTITVSGMASGDTVLLGLTSAWANVTAEMTAKSGGALMSTNNTSGSTVIIQWLDNT